MKPLSQNLKDKVRQALAEQDETIRKITKILCSELVLSLTDFLRDMSVTKDASELGYGAQFEQDFKINQRNRP